MAETPKVVSYDQILGDMTASYMSKQGINDLSTASAVLSFFEAMAQAVYRASVDNLNILKEFNVDRATGEALKRIAREENIVIEGARVATGRVNITDTSFTKISTKIYAGSNPPNVGSTVIRVSDASQFPATGSIYIGRGTANVEGPLPYVSITQVGSFFEINLNPLNPTTKFHNLSETVVLAQGGTRNITAGTIVTSPASGGSPAINFAITESRIILDGEDSITDVPVACTEVGDLGNVPRGAIKTFGASPFTGAAVVNPIPFTNGKNEDSDDLIKNKIKRARISRGLGTSIAIKNSVLNQQATDENARVISSEIVSTGDETTLYIDDGSGYEAKTRGTGLEFIVDSALGGERYFQLTTGGNQTSVAKAFLLSGGSAPFAINPGDRIALLVGGVLSEHVFGSSDFRSNGAASAYEVVSSVNSNPLLSFVATTSASGTKVVLSAKEETNEDIQVTDVSSGNDANNALLFPLSESQTLRLYKNRKPLLRNGRRALVESNNQNLWSSTLATGETLIIAVDSTSSITYTFTDADFIAEGLAGLSSTAPLSAWINVINKKVTGVTASSNGNSFVLASNLGVNSRARISIDPTSSLVTKGVLSPTNLSAIGQESDFTLSRNTAQFKLNQSLQPGDSLTAGTEFTKANITSDQIVGGSLSLASDGFLWVIVDNKDAQSIVTGIAAETLVTVSKPSANIVRYTSSEANATVLVQKGDYVIIWSNELNVNNRLEGRVSEVGTNFFEIRVTAAEYAAAVAQNLVLFQEGISFVRTDKAPQKVKIAAGSYSISNVADIIANQLPGVSTSTIDDEFIEITTDTESTDGAVMIVTFNDPAKSLAFTEGQKDQSIESQFAFSVSSFSQNNFPAFVTGLITNASFADTPDSNIPSFTSSVSSSLASQNDLVCFLHPYSYTGVYSADGQATKECVQIDSSTGNTFNIEEKETVRRLRINDRFYVSLSYDFDYNDSLVAILDNDPTNKTFPIPMYRRVETNNTMSASSTEIRAYDIEAGPTTELSDSFGTSFSFDNYKVMMKAKNAIDPSSLLDEDAVLFRSATWGSGGEKFRVSYEYPTAPDLDIDHTIEVSSFIDVSVFLKSGPVVANQIDGTTEWDVTVTVGAPNATTDTVTYTWNGVGTNPDMTTLSPGHYVTINNQGEFNEGNQGTFKIQTATSSSFSVLRPTGVAVSENNIATLVSGAVLVYENSDTTAQEIVDYVNNNIAEHLSSEILDDNGLTGSGIINASTYEDSNFTSEKVNLVDGLNYVAATTLSAVAPNEQLSFKIPLNLSVFNTNTLNAYSFNEGEELRLIPTTAKQVEEFLNTLAVTGFTTLGEIKAVEDQSKVQFKTNVLGSNGAVEISGGSASENNAPLLNQATKIEGTDLIKMSVNRGLADGIHAGQWLKVEASEVQKKNTGISEVTSVSLYPNVVAPGKTIVELSNREGYDTYFGQPHKMFEDSGRTFHVEKHGSLTCLSWDGNGLDPMFAVSSVNLNADSGNIQVAFDFITGLTSYTATSGTRNFSEVQAEDKLTISGLADAANNGTFNIVGISEDCKTLWTDNLNGVNAAPASVLAGNLVVSHTVKEGDSILISSPFASLNQGKFRIIRKFNNSIYFDNPNSIEEKVVVLSNLVSIGTDATTEWNVTTPGNMKLSWSGVGTQPDLSLVKVGDILNVGTSFAVGNRGSLTVLKVRGAESESFVIQAPSSDAVSGAERFEFELPNGTEYYLWADKDGASIDPAIVGKTGVSFAINTGDSNSDNAENIATALNTIVGVSAVASGETVVVEFTDSGDVTDPQNIDIGGGFSIQVLRQGTTPHLELANASAVVESGVTVNGVGGNILTVHRPAINFYPYDASVPGDKFVVSGNILSSDNRGSYVIESVLDQNSVVVTGAMDAKYLVNLASSANQVYVEEERPYVGYKQVVHAIVDPANVNRSLIVLDNSKDFGKIGTVGAVALKSVTKLQYPSGVVTGFDAYRYHTGLIALSNRVVYGDPRDTVTYPGVSAAGAEIFIREPLVRRITVSINIRVNTGVPFARVSEQVRSNIAALINSTPVGQSIAISDIIASVNAISGVQAVSITSPSYSPTNDVIVVNPSEKPVVLDIVKDIAVSKVE